VLAGAVAWAGIVWARGKGERAYQHRELQAREPRDPDDEIDHEELERAEREVRDLDINARPEDGFTGDDWGPGAPRPPVA
jgi:hypothetical protein